MTAAEPGITFGITSLDREELSVCANPGTGHENMGIVEELGEGVTLG